MSQLTHDVFVCEPIPQAITSLVPNGERRMFSPLSVTLISGDEDAVLVDPPLTVAQAEDVAHWIEASGKRLTHILATHGHGDHWFSAGLLADRFGARVVASEPTIEQMRRNVAIRPQFWDALFPGQLPEAEVTAVTVLGGLIELEGHELRIIDVGHTDTDGTSVLHVPSIGLVAAGDVLYNNVHQYLREAQGDGIEQWLAAVDTVEALAPRQVVAGHKDKTRDDDATRVIAETRSYLLTARGQLAVQTSAIDFFHAMLAAYPDRLNAGALWSSATALYPPS